MESDKKESFNIGHWQMLIDIGHLCNCTDWKHVTSEPRGNISAYAVEVSFSAPVPVPMLMLYELTGSYGHTHSYPHTPHNYGLRYYTK
jgi:hypothetical protein